MKIKSNLTAAPKSLAAPQQTWAQVGAVTNMHRRRARWVERVREILYLFFGAVLNIFALTSRHIYINFQLKREHWEWVPLKLLIFCRLQFCPLATQLPQPVSPFHSFPFLTLHISINQLNLRLKCKVQSRRI